MMIEVRWPSPPPSDKPLWDSEMGVLQGACDETFEDFLARMVQFFRSDQPHELGWERLTSPDAAASAWSGSGRDNDYMWTVAVEQVHPIEPHTTEHSRMRSMPAGDATLLLATEERRTAVAWRLSFARVDAAGNRFRVPVEDVWRWVIKSVRLSRSLELLPVRLA
jgi:hypothetical protein